MIESELSPCRRLGRLVALIVAFALIHGSLCPAAEARVKDDDPHFIFEQNETAFFIAIFVGAAIAFVILNSAKAPKAPATIHGTRSGQPVMPVTDSLRVPGLGDSLVVPAGIRSESASGEVDSTHSPR